MPSDESPKPVKLVRAIAVARQLDCATSTVYGLAKRREIPSVATGKRGVRFDLEAVMKTLQRDANGK